MENENQILEKQTTRTLNLTKGSIWGQIFLFALPIIVGNLLQELYSVVDTIIVGQTLGNIKLAAVGSTAALTYLAVGFVTGLTSGCTVLTAQFYGAQDTKALKRSVAAHWLIAAVAAVLLTILFVVCAAPMLRLLHTTDATYPHALAYISTIYGGIPATMLYNVMAALFRSVGDSKTPLVLLVFSSLLNIGLDFLFILAFRWDVPGAAAATILSQLLSGILCCFLLKRGAAFLIPDKSSWQGLRDGFTPMIGSVLEVGMRVLFPAVLCAVLGFTAIAMAGPAAWTASAGLMPIVYFEKMNERKGKKHMTELEKLDAGLEYDFWDDAVEERKQKAIDGCKSLNALDVRHTIARQAAIHELFGSVGENAAVLPAFNCDNGANIHVGKNFIANYNVTILDIAPVRIGDYVMIGPNTLISTVNHPLTPIGRRKHLGIAKPVTIGNDVWLGGNVTVLPGVSIGSNVVVAAGAVVTKDVPDNCLVGGVPARKIKALPNDTGDQA